VKRWIARGDLAGRRGLAGHGKIAVCAVLALLVVGCALPKRPAAQRPLPSSAADSVEGLASAIQADSRRSEHESDAKVRAQLADEAGGYAQACLAKAPQAAACLYGRGVALGLEARAHPTRAGELLKSMLDSLNSADAADPNYDQAGPARVRALVLTRAPGWPLGPGDADAGLASARRAVELQPQYPPNLLALAEALAKTGDAKGARETYARAREAAQALPAAEDRDAWLHEADQGLQRR
jgi:tetratricopeptide (TPR) repeat protein